MTKVSGMLMASHGLFAAEDGADLTPENNVGNVAPSDNTATVVVNTPDTSVPAAGDETPCDDPSDLETSGDITIIDEPGDDDGDLIDVNDDDDAADVAGGVDALLHAEMTTARQCAAVEIIEQHGIDPLTAGMLLRNGLMSESALGGMSSESLNGAYAGSHEAGMSAEALASAAADVIKGAAGEGAEKTAGSIFSKVVARVTSLGTILSKATKTAENAAVSELEKASTRIVKTADGKIVRKAVTSTTKDAINAGETAVKEGARRITATQAVAIAASIAAIGIGLKTVISGIPAANATAAAKNSYFSKVVAWVKGIKLPWAKLDVAEDGKLTVNGNTVKSATTAAEEAAEKVATSGPLGWTKQALESIKGQITGAGEKIGSSFSGVASKFGALNSAGEAASKAASEQITAKGGSATLAKVGGIFAHSSYVAGVMIVLSLIAAVVYFVVVGGLRLIRKSAQGA